LAVKCSNVRTDNYKQNKLIFQQSTLPLRIMDDFVPLTCMRFSTHSKKNFK